MLSFNKINYLCLFVGILIFGLNIKYQLSLLWLLVLGLLWITITVIGIFHIRWNYFVKGRHCGSKTSGKIALTFDDGPNAKYTPIILDLLKEYGAKATFFCIGKHVENHLDIFKRIIIEGHVIGNHSYCHSVNYGFLPKENIEEDIDECNHVVKSVLTKKPKLYRPPFGVTNPAIAKAVESLKMTCCGWSIRSLDTRATSSNQIIKRVNITS